LDLLLRNSAEDFLAVIKKEMELIITNHSVFDSEPYTWIMFQHEQDIAIVDGQGNPVAFLLSSGTILLTPPNSKA